MSRHPDQLEHDLARYQAQQDKAIAAYEAAWDCIQTRWDANPEDCAQLAIEDGALDDVPKLMPLLASMAAHANANNGTPEWYRVAGQQLMEFRHLLMNYQAEQEDNDG